MPSGNGSTSPNYTPAWRPTTSHSRTTLGGLTLAILALAYGRPDLLVLATPLLVISIWSVLARPIDIPRFTERLDHRRLREGEATTWTFIVDPCRGLDEVVAWVVAPAYVELWPPGGVRAVGPGEGERRDGPIKARVAIRALRWGRRDLGPASLSATSVWNAFRWSPGRISPRQLVTVPARTPYDSTAPVPHPSGLVGLHRSARRGEGSEFASIRPFQLGDRLRRIHWPVSLRTGTLHVRGTWADQDAQVVILLDAQNDIGVSEGIDGKASSLDVAARAAGAVAEHYLQRGDRVELRIVDSSGLMRLRAGSGKRHLLRTLDMLSTMHAGSRYGFDTRLTHTQLSAGGLVIMLSPLVAPQALAEAVSLARSGLSTLVVDTLPPDATQSDPENPFVELAWRIRLLEREREIRRVEELGVSVVAWSGPGSLDDILRRLARRSAVPRMAPR
jgi:uncharacterized protein (DUF58 family)